MNIWLHLLRYSRERFSQSFHEMGHRPPPHPPGVDWHNKYRSGSDKSAGKDGAAGAATQGTAAPGSDGSADEDGGAASGVFLHRKVQTAVAGTQTKVGPIYPVVLELASTLLSSLLSAPPPRNHNENCFVPTAEEGSFLRSVRSLEVVHPSFARIRNLLSRLNIEMIVERVILEYGSRPRYRRFRRRSRQEAQAVQAHDERGALGSHQGGRSEEFPAEPGRRGADPDEAEDD